MSKIYISINQFAEFSTATEKGKSRIVKQQKVVDLIRVSWYQRAKGAIRRFFKNVNDDKPIDDALEVLKLFVPKTDHQKYDRETSIAALELMKQIRLPKNLRILEYTVIHAQEKSILLNNVDLIVAPDIILKAEHKDRIIYGGVKIHISKRKPFNLNQATYVAVAIFEFLSKKVAKNEERVAPELCFCLDVFAKRLVPAPDTVSDVVRHMKIICRDVETHWGAPTG